MSDVKQVIRLEKLQVDQMNVKYRSESETDMVGLDASGIEPQGTLLFMVGKGVVFNFDFSADDLNPRILYDRQQI